MHQQQRLAGSTEHWPHAAKARLAYKVAEASRRPETAYTLNQTAEPTVATRTRLAAITPSPVADLHAGRGFAQVRLKTTAILVFHLPAKPPVGAACPDPVETFFTSVMDLYPRLDDPAACESQLCRR